MSIITYDFGKYLNTEFFINEWEKNINENCNFPFYFTKYLVENCIDIGYFIVKLACKNNKNFFDQALKIIGILVDFFMKKSIIRIVADAIIFIISKSKDEQLSKYLTKDLDNELLVILHVIKESQFSNEFTLFFSSKISQKSLEIFSQLDKSYKIFTKMSKKLQEFQLKEMEKKEVSKPPIGAVQSIRDPLSGELKWLNEHGCVIEIKKEEEKKKKENIFTIGNLAICMIDILEKCRRENKKIDDDAYELINNIIKKGIEN